MFFLLISLNVTPFLRGPADWPPEWRWGYYYVPTWARLWAPLATFTILTSYFFYLEKKLRSAVKLTHILVLLFLSLVFYFSVLYFSRAGIFVLFGRLIQKDANGYFTTAIKIDNWYVFMRSFEKLVLTLPGHARGHPPLAIFPFWLVNQFFIAFPKITHLFLSLASKPQTPAVANIWNNLPATAQATALFSIALIPLMATLSILPLFLWTKNFGSRTALRATLVWTLVPAVTLFLPLNDIFLPFFVCLSLFFWQKRTKAANLWAGLTLAIGILFSLSLLPILIYFFIDSLWSKKLLKAKNFFFLLGFLLPFALLRIFLNFNILTVSKLMVSGQAPRSYWPWLFYNLYDFFIFVGLPLALIYFYQVFLLFKKKLTVDKIMVISSGLTLLALDISGISRAETGRIWLPLMPLVVVPAVGFLTSQLRLTGKQFFFILGLLFIQLVVLTEFWVTLW